VYGQCVNKVCVISGMAATSKGSNILCSMPDKQADLRKTVTDIKGCNVFRCRYMM
jgi:hypothetical protein